MTNSELFTAAHKLAKTFEGDYEACFILALEDLRATKMYVNNSTRGLGVVISEEAKKVVVKFEDGSELSLLKAFITIYNSKEEALVIKEEEEEEEEIDIEQFRKNLNKAEDRRIEKARDFYMNYVR